MTIVAGGLRVAEQTVKAALGSQVGVVGLRVLGVWWELCLGSRLLGMILEKCHFACNSAPYTALYDLKFHYLVCK